jgi:hypothetical protein
MANWNWTGLEGVNVPALLVCLAVSVALLVIGISWVRKVETRSRGIAALSIILLPAMLSALVLGLRCLVQ